MSPVAPFKSTESHEDDKLQVNSLTPLDASIRPRDYIIPDTTNPLGAPTPGVYGTPLPISPTSVSTINVKKRTHLSAFGDEEEEQGTAVDANDEGMPKVSPSEMDLILEMRRRNTVAARRSRKRKLDYIKELETALEQERLARELAVAELRERGAKDPIASSDFSDSRHS